MNNYILIDVTYIILTAYLLANYTDMLLEAVIDRIYKDHGQIPMRSTENFKTLNINKGTYKMCAGICGPQNPIKENRSYAKPKLITKPFKGPYGTVLMRWGGPGIGNLDIIETKDGGYLVSWSSRLSSGCETYTKKEEAFSRFKNKLPKGYEK